MFSRRVTEYDEQEIQFVAFFNDVDILTLERRYISTTYWFIASLDITSVHFYFDFNLRKVTNREIFPFCSSVGELDDFI